MEKDSLKYKIFLTLSVLVIAIVFFMIVPKFYDNSHAKFTYTLLEDGTVTVDGYTGSPKKLELPEEIDGYTVSAISNSAFTNKAELEKVTLPSTLHTIGEYAFYNCTGLKTVEGQGVEQIGYAAFYGCYYLKEVTWSDNLRSIGDSAFASCTRLRAMSVPATCEYIGTDAFMACESLVLDCSENETAAAVAAQYGIPTNFAESDEWLLIKVGVVTLIAVAAVVTLLWFLNHRKKVKKISKKA